MPGVHVDGMDVLKVGGHSAGQDTFSLFSDLKDTVERAREQLLRVDAMDVLKVGDWPRAGSERSH